MNYIFMYVLQLFRSNLVDKSFTSFLNQINTTRFVAKFRLMSSMLKIFNISYFFLGSASNTERPDILVWQLTW